MNRIDQIFTDLRGIGDKALMPFITAGDPDLVATRHMLEAFEGAGASICEVGIPFSDPIADGPVIAASMTRALAGGLHVEELFGMIATLRPKLQIGLVAMASYSIVHRFGVDCFVQKAKKAGFDGFIFPDLSLEESRFARAAARDAGLIFSMLIAPTTPIERAREIAGACSGFIYLLSRSGLTGEQTTLPTGLGDQIRNIRQVTDLPIAVGFGISTADQVNQVLSMADAAIVGSAIVRRIDAHRGEEASRIAQEAGQFVAELAGGLPRGNR